MPPDEEMRKRLMKAIEASRRVDEFYENDALHRILATDADGNYLSPPAEVPKLFFNDGPDAAANIEAYIRQDMDPTFLEDYAAWVLHQEVPTTDGVFDLDVLIAWADRYAGALTMLPGFKNKVEKAREATEGLAGARAKRAATMAELRRSPMQLFLDHDPATATRMLFVMPDTAEAMRQMLEAMEGNAEGLAGLRKSVTNHIADYIGVDASKADAFSAFISDNEAALTMLFEPRQMQQLRAVEADIHRSAISLVPLPEPPAKKSWLKKIFG